VMAGVAPVWFTEWATVLDGVTRDRYRRSVIGYLHHLKVRRLRASLEEERSHP
jgi:hypothetical protein